MENMRETAKTLCQLWEASDLWEDQNCQFVNDYTAIFLFQSLRSKSYLQINFIQLKEKNKHVVLKEPSPFFLSFLPYAFFFLLLISLFIHLFSAYLAENQMLFLLSYPKSKYDCFFLYIFKNYEE